jgi:hypothetical protein
MAAPPFVARGQLALATALARDAQVDPQAVRALRIEAHRLADTLGLPAIGAAAGAAVGGEPTGTERPASAPSASLVKSGEIWKLTYRGRVSLLKPLRGTEYLVRLLRAPGCDVHVLELTAGGLRSSGDTLATEALLDQRGKREIRERIEDLREDLREAEANADLGRAAVARAEIESIGAYLAKSVGLRGRDRRVTGAPERARAAVTKAIRAAIRQIARVEPDLADLLSRAVRTGAFCRYDPLAELPIVWHIDTGTG